MTMVWRTLVLVLLFMGLMASPLRADAAVDDIARQLVCQCGCNMVLSNCAHGECMSRDAMLTTIEQKLTQGESAAQIIPFFVAQYGEQVLASPPKKGFNLTAWIGPYIAILVGAAVIYFAIRKWVKQGSQPVPGTRIESKGEDEKYQRQLEAELKQFGERGFR